MVLTTNKAAIRLLHETSRLGSSALSSDATAGSFLFTRSKRCCYVIHRFSEAPVAPRHLLSWHSAVVASSLKDQKKMKRLSTTNDNKEFTYQEKERNDLLFANFPAYTGFPESNPSNDIDKKVENVETASISSGIVKHSTEMSS